MMQFNRSLLKMGLLPVALCMVLTGCKDDKYDLSDIDTSNSRIAISDLTFPLNLKQIKLKDVIDFDDNENITTIGDEYAIQKNGEFGTDPFKIDPISVNSVAINSTTVPIPMPGSIPSTGIVLPQPINEQVALPHIDSRNYDINLHDIDKALLAIQNIKTTATNPIKVDVTLNIPSSLMNGGNEISFSDLKIKLPWGLMLSELPAGATYDSETGDFSLETLPVNSNGVAKLSLVANGIELGDKGNIVNNSLNISDEVGVKSGNIDFTVKTANIPSNFNLEIDYNVSSFTLAKFSGDINYEMEGISIDPISLSDLPDFLDSPETKLYIANPSIDIKLKNPVGQFGLKGSGMIKLVSDFKGGNSTTAQANINVADQAETTLNFDNANFTNLGGILANDYEGGLPETIEVKLDDLKFFGHATDFPIGESFGEASGDYTFTAPLGFGNGTFIVYETTEDGMGSDDMDDIYINYFKINANCDNNLPVGVKIEITPIDRQGKEIQVEDNTFELEAMSQGEPVNLSIKSINGTPIKDFDGVKVRATVRQDSGNTQAIGPDLFINLYNLQLTLDGYYDIDF